LSTDDQGHGRDEARDFSPAKAPRLSLRRTLTAFAIAAVSFAGFATQPACAPDACADGVTECGRDCVDLSKDIENCGECGHRCPAAGGEAICSSGDCSLDCPAGKLDCGDRCADLLLDALNCGACGNACASGRNCGAGVCDTTAPGVVITASDTALNLGKVTTVTFTTTAAAVGFTADDVTVTNGALSSFTATSSTVYTATLAPDIGVTGQITVAVAAGRFTDQDMVPNQPAAPLMLPVDTVRPTIVITQSGSMPFFPPNSGAKTTVLFKLSEPSTTFAEGDIVVTGGSLSNFVALSSFGYLADFTASAAGTARVNVAAALFTDAAGNGNEAAAELTLAVASNG
jgi:hypothetical protein